MPVLSDECYVEFTWSGPPRTILEHGPDGVLAVHSLSKRSNLAGVRAGFYAGDGDLVHYLREVRKHAGFMVPGPVQAAAVVAYADDDHVDAQRERYRDRLERLRAVLRRRSRPRRADAGRRVLPVGRRARRADAWSLAKRLATDAGALVSPGDFYGPDGAGHVRIAVVQPDERIDLVGRAARRLTERRPLPSAPMADLRVEHRRAVAAPLRARTRRRRRPDDRARGDHAARSRRGSRRGGGRRRRRRPRVAEAGDPAAVLAARRWRPIEVGPFEYADKIPLKRGYAEQGVRVVPGASARFGAFLDRGVILMPSYVNIGARVGANTMVDTWATVGSCAQIGANVHLSGGVGIGGVLEPPQAAPVIDRRQRAHRQPLHGHAGRTGRRRCGPRRRLRAQSRHPRHRRPDR